MMAVLFERQETRRAALATAIARFVAALEARPMRLFLHAQGDRTPREIVAHLIGWNHAAVVARAAIARGELPESRVDSGPDLGKTNARAMATYGSQDKATLPAQVRDAAAAWDAMLRALPGAERDQANGVRLGAWSISNGAMVEALTEDYDHHRKEINQWPT